MLVIKALGVSGGSGRVVVDVLSVLLKSFGGLVDFHRPRIESCCGCMRR